MTTWMIVLETTSLPVAVACGRRVSSNVPERDGSAIPGQNPTVLRNPNGLRFN